MKPEELDLCDWSRRRFVKGYVVDGEDVAKALGLNLDEVKRTAR